MDLSNMTFEQACAELQKSEHKEKMKTIVPNIDEKIALSAYLINSFSDEILSVNKNPLEELLLKRSNSFVNHIHNEDITDEICEEYSKLFNTWKEKDKKDQIEVYLELYDSYKRMNTPESESIVNDLYKALSFLAKDKTDELITNYQNNHNMRTLRDRLQYQVDVQMRQAYWDSVELTDDQIISWIKDAKNYLFQIYDQYAHSNVEKTDAEEYLDLDYIEEQIRQKTYNLDRLLHWLLEKVKVIDASKFDQEYLIMHEKINTKDYKIVVRFILEHLEDLYLFSITSK